MGFVGSELGSEIGKEEPIVIFKRLQESLLEFFF